MDRGSVQITPRNVSFTKLLGVQATQKTVETSSEVRLFCEINQAITRVFAENISLQRGRILNKAPPFMNQEARTNLDHVGEKRRWEGLPRLVDHEEAVDHHLESLNYSRSLGKVKIKGQSVGTATPSFVFSGSHVWGGPNSLFMRHAVHLILVKVVKIRVVVAKSSWV